MSEEVKELIQKVVKGELPKEDLPKPILIEDLGMMYATRNDKQKRRFGLYVCGFCGNEFKAQVQHIKCGGTRSCGCYSIKRLKERTTKHRLIHTRLYSIWANMKDRVFNIKNKDYYNYGGRGITICAEWKNDFLSFYDWAMSNGYSDELSLDRIDNNGNYEPENCRWTTSTIQMRNKKLYKNNTSGYKGVHFDKKSGKYITKIYVNKIHIRLGSFSTAVEGAIAYNNYIIENNLEGFILNEIPEEYLNKIQRRIGIEKSFIN